MFRKLLLAATALVVPLAAQAADITLRKDKTGRPMVVINGDIQFGDHDKFVRVAGRSPPSTIIALNSEGGVLIDALQIGHDIRNKRFWTVAGSVCASACAYIWLAGIERGAFDDSQIGFHNVYNADTNEATGAGNAVLGAYLTKLGFSYNTIIYMTSAKAAEMEWFSFEAGQEIWNQGDQAARHQDRATAATAAAAAATPRSHLKTPGGISVATLAIRNAEDRNDDDTKDDRYKLGVKQ
jgi:hypothetical protein